jgi:hypothetical protein
VTAGHLGQQTAAIDLRHNPQLLVLPPPATALYPGDDLHPAIRL